MQWFKNKEVLLIQAMNVTLLAVIGATYFFDPKTSGQLAALVGTVWLSVLLIAPKLLKMKALKRWHSDLLMIARNSKWMGVWTALWFAMHAVVMVFAYLDTSSLTVVIGSVLQRETILGFLALLIFIVLLAISNTWSYRHVTWWKQLNMLVWLVVPLGFTHALLAAARYTGNWPTPIVLLLFGLVAVVGLVAKFRADADYFAGLRVRLILGGVALGLLVAFIY